VDNLKREIELIKSQNILILENNAFNYFKKLRNVKEKKK